VTVVYSSSCLYKELHININNKITFFLFYCVVKLAIHCKYDFHTPLMWVMNAFTLLSTIIL
jgi:hypothetical protein